MNQLQCEGMLLLLELEVLLRLGGLKSIRCRMQATTASPPPHKWRPNVEAICRAMDFACVFYFKRTFCLQRSAATALLLKKYGYDAALLVGAQTLPLKSHAWVEVDSTVVNDKHYVREMYQVIDCLSGEVSP